MHSTPYSTRIRTPIQPISDPLFDPYPTPIPQLAERLTYDSLFEEWYTDAAAAAVREEQVRSRLLLPHPRPLSRLTHTPLSPP